MLIESDSHVTEAFKVIKHYGQLVGVHFRDEVLILAKELVSLVDVVQQLCLVFIKILL